MNRSTTIAVGVLCAIVATPGAKFAEAGGPVVVFAGNYLQRSTTATEPEPDQLKDVLQVFAAPGEYEPVTVSIRALKSLKRVQIRLANDLTADSGQTIRAEAVTIRLADPMESWSGKSGIEQFLLKTNAVDIPAGTTRRFWLTVHVPTDAKPGTYRSTITIGKPMGELGPDLLRLETLKSLTYELHVLPIKLATPHETGMGYFMYNNTAYFARAPEGGAEDFITETYQTRVFEDMREHGMTTASVYLYPVIDGECTLDGRTDNYLGFTQTMEMLDKTDLVAPGVPVIWLGMGDDPVLWKMVLDEGRRSNWPEIACYGVDEPGDEERNHQVRESMKGINAFRAKYPEYGLRMTTALGSSRGIQTVGHFYDLWIGCMAQRIGETGVIAQAKMQDKELWVYDCMAAPVDAETDRYYFGVWAWVSGVKGVSHWAYFDAGSKLSYVYPTKDELVPTVGWEAVREGIDDYRYLTTLRKLADKARAAGRDDLAKGADPLFAKVQTMVTMDNYGKAYHEALGGRSPTELDASAYNRRRSEPHLSIDAYDKLRREIAKEIQKISQALGG